MEIVEKGRLDPSVLPLHPRHTHFVELYDDDAGLIESVHRFVANGVDKAAAAVIIATPEHRAELDVALGSKLDVGALRAEGLYTTLDARETLETFMREGSPDRHLFERVVGGVIDSAAAHGREVRAFGEMVALLWAEGNVAGALALEDLWNDLAETRRFKLFCAYPSRAFPSKNPAPLNAVCERHSHVLVPARAAV